jgi:predicted HicB family RNase H-like nuclease
MKKALETTCEVSPQPAGSNVSYSSTEEKKETFDLKNRDVEECLQSNRNFNRNNRGKFSLRTPEQLRTAATTAIAASMRRYASCS